MRITKLDIQWSTMGFVVVKGRTSTAETSVPIIQSGTTVGVKTFFGTMYHAQTLKAQRYWTQVNSGKLSTKKKRKVAGPDCFLTRRCAPSYLSPQNPDHRLPSISESGNSRAPSPELVPSDFSLWNPKVYALKYCRLVDGSKVKGVGHDWQP